MKKYLSYFIFLSLVFLVVALVKADYLLLPKIESGIFIAVSFLILFAGFLVDNFSWYATLKIMGRPARFGDSIISGGFSVFGKYIPGKVWTIAGRSAYIAKRYDYREKDTVNISVQAELLSVWIGLTVGSLALFLLDNPGVYLILSWAMALFFGLIILWEWPHSIFLRMLKIVFKKDFELPLISAKQVWRVLPWFLLKWVFFGISFWFLARGLGAADFSWYMGMGFPLAGTLGILAIVMPGGIGVREGILTWYLVALGLDLSMATTISVSSRLWFLCGELFLFLSAVAVRAFQPKQKK